MEIEYLKKKKDYAQVSQLFLSNIVVACATPPSSCFFFGGGPGKNMLGVGAVSSCWLLNLPLLWFQLTYLYMHTYKLCKFKKKNEQI